MLIYKVVRMYIRIFKIVFKDETSKNMVMVYGNHEFNKKGFEEHGILAKFWVNQSKTNASLIIIYPNEKQFKLNAKENGKSFIDLLTSQGNKVEIVDGELINSGFSEALESFLEATGEKHTFPLSGK